MRSRIALAALALLALPALAHADSFTIDFDTDVGVFLESLFGSGRHDH